MSLLIDEVNILDGSGVGGFHFILPMTAWETQKPLDMPIPQDKSLQRMASDEKLKV